MHAFLYCKRVVADCTILIREIYQRDGEVIIRYSGEMHTRQNLAFRQIERFTRNGIAYQYSFYCTYTPTQAIPKHTNKVYGAYKSITFPFPTNSIDRMWKL